MSACQRTDLLTPALSSRGGEGEDSGQVRWRRAAPLWGPPPHVGGYEATGGEILKQALSLFPCSYGVATLKNRWGRELMLEAVQEVLAPVATRVPVRSTQVVWGRVSLASTR